MSIKKIIPLLFSVFVTSSVFAQKIKTHEKVQIGGIGQWIGAVGDDADLPVLLFLHGGPGFTSRGYAKSLIKQLKDEFIIVQWDQRGTGITEAWSPNQDSLTLKLFYSDTKEVIDYVRERFSKDKIYLVGFSWGGFLGIEMANRYPELLHAYVHLSGAVNSKESEELNIRLLKEKASEIGNEVAFRELEQVSIPFMTWQDLYYLRKWTAKLLATGGAKRTYPEKLYREWSGRWLPVFNQVLTINHTESIQSIECPIYFMHSRNDFVANHQVTEVFFAQLKARQKELIWINSGGHEFAGDEPKKLANEMKKIKQATFLTE